MSSINYKELFRVNVLHEYYAPSTDKLTTETIPNDYNIWNDLEFLPTVTCKRLLRDCRLLFRPTPMGFVVLGQAAAGKTFISIDEEVKFQFLIKIKNPYFINFTQLPLVSNEGKLYYFRNENGNGLLLNKNTEVDESDRIMWQSPLFRYERTNDTPREVITFTLKDEQGVSLPLGRFASTNKAQDRYQTSNNANEPVNHSIDLSRFPSGRYSMNIGTETLDFYLIDATIASDTFGVIAIYKNTTNNRFVTTDDTIDKKAFVIHFLNRTTTWKYIKPDGTETNNGNEALTKRFSGGTQPNPDVMRIYPELDGSGNVVTVYSEIYLDK